MKGSFLRSLPAAFDLREGLRGAFACTPMLLLGWALDAPGFAWAAIGAFWTTLAAISGTARQRLLAMVDFAAWSTACGAAATWAADQGLAAGTLAVLAVAGGAGFVRSWKPHAYQGAILVATACVVMMDRPAGAAGWHFIVPYALGCLFAAVVGAIAWRLAPPPPEAPPAEPPAPIAHYALRLGPAAALAYLVVHVMGLHYGYWATMAVLLILQPAAAGIWPRCLERAVGTVAGTVIAMGLGLVATTPLAIALAVFPLFGLTMALRAHSYQVFVAFLTPAFILVADFAAPAAGQLYALARLEDNLIGCVIAFLAALLLWPTSGPLGWAHEQARRRPQAYRGPKGPR